jgi:uncharacterized coiled-coil DUF342 family protein
MMNSIHIQIVTQRNRDQAIRNQEQPIHVLRDSLRTLTKRYERLNTKEMSVYILSQLQPHIPGLRCFVAKISIIEHNINKINDENRDLLARIKALEMISGELVVDRSSTNEEIATLKNSTESATDLYCAGWSDSRL